MSARFRNFVRRYHVIVPLVGLITLATQTGCPPMRPVITMQESVKLDHPVTLQPDYVVAEVRNAAEDHVSPPLYYAFQVDGNRELQIYPGKSSFVVMVDKTTGKAHRVDKTAESSRDRARPAGLTGPNGPLQFYQMEISGEIRLFGRTPPTPVDMIMLVSKDRSEVMYVSPELGLCVRGKADPVLLDKLGPPRPEKLRWPDANGWFIPDPIGRSSLFPKDIAPWPARAE